MQTIYLDYAATTPLDPRVVTTIQNVLSDPLSFGNPASIHGYGKKARALVEQAREQVAGLLMTEPENIIWTSGATEANNLAIKGIAQFYQHKGKHLISYQTEHSSVLDTCHALERLGYSISYLKPKSDGRIDLEQLKQALRTDTILISLMHVNNEIGVIQDIFAVGEITRSKGIMLHVDAAQSVGKIPLNVNTYAVDLLSLSSHKLYGPKGIGALYIHPRVGIKAQIHGGGHERGLRSGTLATHQIVGMGTAFALAKQEMTQDREHIQSLSDKLWQGIEPIKDTVRHGNLSFTFPGILNISFLGVDSHHLLQALPQIALARSAACNTATLQTSYVLQALGCNLAQTKSAVRISLGRFTTQAEIEEAITQIKAAVLQLRGRNSGE